MKKIAFLFSCLTIVLGIITIIITSILNKVMPKLGYIAFQAAAAGSYSEDFYKINFTFVNFLAVAMIIGGTAISIKMYLSSGDM